MNYRTSFDNAQELVVRWVCEKLESRSAIIDLAGTGEIVISLRDGEKEISRGVPLDLLLKAKVDLLCIEAKRAIEDLRGADDERKDTKEGDGKASTFVSSVSGSLGTGRRIADEIFKSAPLSS